MGRFSDNSRVQKAYDEGNADGRTSRRTGTFTSANRRGTERPDDEANAYNIGHGDGQDQETHGDDYKPHWL